MTAYSNAYNIAKAEVLPGKHTITTFTGAGTAAEILIPANSARTSLTITSVGGAQTAVVSQAAAPTAANGQSLQASGGNVLTLLGSGAYNIVASATGLVVTITETSH